MMGLGAGELGIILEIVLVVFGGKKLRNLGSDLGGAISEFKTSLNDDGEEEEEQKTEAAKEATTVEAKAKTTEVTE